MSSNVIENAITIKGWCKFEHRVAGMKQNNQMSVSITGGQLVDRVFEELLVHQRCPPSHVTGGAKSVFFTAPLPLFFPSFHSCDMCHVTGESP